MIEGPLVFFACVIIGTFLVLAALYSVARDAKPDSGRAHFHRVRFWNFR
jgi:hypothetical protein